VRFSQLSSSNVRYKIELGQNKRLFFCVKHVVFCVGFRGKFNVSRYFKSVIIEFNSTDNHNSQPVHNDPAGL